MWVTNEIITQTDFDKIQEILDSFTISNDVGRIPYCIGSGFSGFKGRSVAIVDNYYSL